MKMTSNFKLGVCLLVLYLFPFVAMAQDEDPGFPTEDPGAPTAPIDDWVLPMFIIGLLLVYYFYRKYQYSISK